MSVVLEASGVHKRYSTGAAVVHAVRGVSLCARRGEMIAIVGPSGSGKSTLLNLLAGLDVPDEGEVTIAGSTLSLLNDDQLTMLRRQKVGLVFQFFNLLPLLSAEENVSLPLLLAGVSPRQASQRARELLGRMGLGARAGHKPRELSGGEMQRVAIARALGARPPVILADEPTGNLDSKTGVAVLELLRDIAQEDACAMVIVTHDHKVARAADRVISYADGNIVSDERGQRTVSDIGHLAPAPKMGS